MYENYVVKPEQSYLPCYVKCLKEELLHTLSEDALKRSPINDPTILQYKGRILGSKSHVSDFADWTGFLLEGYGPKHTCLSLGSGIGRVERYLIKIAFASSFETIELNPRHVAMAKLTDGRIKAHEGDLNFIELRANTYDFILCHGVLHHLINLEHVLEQINYALKPDGLLLIYEYVGEDRWQFNEARLNRLREMFPDIKLNNPPIWKLSGFESVRSGDLLKLITTQFGRVCERSVNYGGVFFPLVICNWRSARRKIKRIVELDESVSQRLELEPCYHMGVYRKSSELLPQARPWTDEQLNAKLFPPMPVHQRLVHIGNCVRSKVRLRTRLRSLLAVIKALFNRNNQRRIWKT